MAYQMLQNQNEQPDFQILKTKNLEEKSKEVGSQLHLNFFQGDNGVEQQQQQKKKI